MRLTAKADIAAPAAQVFAALTDHASFERQALRRGADVRRADKLGPLGPGLVPGAAWRVVFPFRGRERHALIEVERVEPSALLVGRAEGGGLAARTTADLLALSRATTRLTLAVEIEARTLAARLLLQGMRLARGTLERRAEARLALWAKEVEARARRAG